MPHLRVFNKSITGPYYPVFWTETGILNLALCVLQLAYKYAS